jgi:hypothetical protein
MPGKKLPRSIRGRSLGGRLRLERLEDRTLLTAGLYPNPLELVPPYTGTGPIQSVAGDFANNGKMDFAAVTTNGALLVYMGNGDGTFQSPISYNLVGGNSITVGDFAHNGKLDLAIASSNQVSVLVGNGDGTFQTPVNYVAPVNGDSIAVGDFSGDGKLDIVATGNQSNIAVLYGNGDGTFSGEQSFAATSMPRQVVVGDFNGDGKADVAVAGNAVAVLLGNGNGTFQAPINLPNNFGSYSIAAGDFNGDGHLDLATASATESGGVQIWQGDGTGHFQAGAFYATEPLPSGIAVADLNGDGKPDLITANGYDDSVSVLLNRGDGTFAAETKYDVATGPANVLAADFGGNHHPDILSTGAQFAVITNRGDGTFQDAYQIQAGTATLNQVVTGDLNGDKVPDIVATDYLGNGVEVLLNDGHGHFGAPVFYSTGPGSNPRGVALADLNHDGKLDMVVTDSNTNAISIFLGNGDGTFQSPVTYSTAGSYPDAVAVGDVNGDGKLDVVTIDFSSEDISVFPGNGDGTFGKASKFPDGLNSPVLPPTFLVLSDFNGDGKLDAAVGYSGGVFILPGNGNGTFGIPISLTAQVGTTVSGMAAADLNGDGKMDLVAMNDLTGHAVVLLNQGNFNFQANSFFVPLYGDPPNDGQGLAIGDCDGNGKLDLVVGSGSSLFAVLAGNGDGTFQAGVVYDGGAAPEYPALADFDGDGKADIVVPNNIQSSSALTILETSAVNASAGNTITQAANATVPFSTTAQSVTLLASVTSKGVGVSEGTVTFSVFQGTTQIGTSVTSGTVAGGTANASYTLPAGQAAGGYTIQAVYNPGPDFNSSNDSSHTLTVTSGGATTVTTAANAMSTYSTSSASVTLNATVTSQGTGVNEGTVTFTVFNGTMPVGAPVTSGTVASGNATATFTVPAGQPAGVYSISAVYNPGPDYLGSQNSTGVLTVNPAATTLIAAPASVPYSTAAEMVTLSAQVVTTGNVGVNEGTLVFQVFNSANQQLGATFHSLPLVNGMASVPFWLPDGTVVGSYTIVVVYNPGPDYQTSSDSSQNLTVTRAVTTTTAANVTAVFSTASQSVKLSATASSSDGGVTEGSVTFTVFAAGNVQVGSAVTAAPDVYGTANANFVLPAGEPAATYTVDAVYNPGADYQGSTDSAHTLIVNPAATTTVAPGASAKYSSGTQSATLSADVTSGGVGVSEGVVSFTVLQGMTIVGGPGVSGTVSGGVATASTTLLAGLAPGSYTVRAVYSDTGGDYAASDDSGQPGTLSVTAAATSTTVPTAQVAGSASAQSVTLQAQVTSTGGSVSQGAVSFTVLQGNTVIGLPVTSGTVSGGSASASFTVPAGTPVGLYTIQASYGGSTDYLAASPATGTLKVDGPPILPPINGTNVVTGTPNQLNAYAVALNASSPVGNALTYSVALAGDNPLYDLERQYGFQGLTYYKNQGTLGYLLQANANNAFGNPFYLIRPSDGALLAYRGGTYADTFANVTPTAVLGANVYTDPNLLVKAQAPINYSLLASLEQQYGFVGLQYYTNGGNSAYLLQAASNNRNGNLIYLLRATDGGLFAYGGGSYAATYADPNNLIATLGAGLYNHPALLTNASEPLSVYTSLYQLNQQFDLQELNGSFYTNMFGHEAEWYFSPVLNQYGQPWYTLTLQTVANSEKAVLTAWQGYMDSEVGSVVATLDPSVYSHPSWLSGAVAVPNPPAGTASVDASGTLDVGLPYPGFLGSFKVTVTVSDGLLSTSQTATVTCTDTAPTLTFSQGTTPVAAGSNLTLPQGDFPQSFTATGASSDPSANVTVSASVSNSSPLFALEEQYRFQGMQYFSSGGNTAYVLQSAGNNRNGYPVYLLTPSGDVYAYAGGSYADTYADSGNRIASLGSLVYADPTLLTGAMPALDYQTLYTLERQYHFQGVQYYTSGGNSAYVLQASSNNANGNPIYLVSPAGGLYAYGGGSYAATFANPADLVATLDPQVYAQPALLTGARATPALYPQLQAVESAYDLTGLQYYSNTGVPAYVLQAPQRNFNGNAYYLLLPTGGLYAYAGGTYAQTIADASNMVALLDPSVYATPTLLTSAKTPVSATGVTLMPTGSGSSLAYNVNAPASFVGSFQVTVTATDGSLTTTESYRVTATDEPALTAIAPQTISLANPTVQLALTSSQPAGNPLTYTAKVTGYSLAYNLQQQYQFQGLGYFTTSDGVTVYVLQAANNNANGNPLYLLSSAGGLYAYDGGSEFGTTLSNSADLKGQLSPATYQTPSLLTDARAPQTPPAQASVAGNQLTLNVTGLSAGTVFEVIVAVSDGLATNRSSFLVTVSA